MYTILKLVCGAYNIQVRLAFAVTSQLTSASIAFCSVSHSGREHSLQGCKNHKVHPTSEMLTGLEGFWQPPYSL